VNIPAPLSTVPARLEGWGLACAGAIPALMLLWPPRPTQQDRDVMLHASPAFSSDGLRSIPLRNSLRAAVALAIAVFVAQGLSVQHAFWVVLGTLSVLRSTALGTASSVWRALIGTSVGIVIGVGLILLIGTDESALWPVLPFAVLLAAYAPRAISFAAGQAGFTVVLLILFDLIEPAGWTVGLIRIEDVVIGFTISLAVGLLCWPRFAARATG
jgi:uncharacterized membrane protein YccC